MDYSIEDRYSVEALDNHFKDIPLASTGKAQVATFTRAPSFTRAQGTFNIWPISGHCDGDELDERTPSPSISRLTIFSRGAQPLFPPWIYTRSDPDILRANLGRIVPAFRQIPRTRNSYTFDRFYKLADMRTIPARSDDLKNFISKKIKSGGLKEERTKEQWEATFDVDWYKVQVLPYEMDDEKDPMEIKDIRGFLDGLSQVK